MKRNHFKQLNKVNKGTKGKNINIASKERSQATLCHPQSKNTEKKSHVHKFLFMDDTVFTVQQSDFISTDVWTMHREQGQQPNLFPSCKAHTFISLWGLFCHQSLFKFPMTEISEVLACCSWISNHST